MLIFYIYTIFAKRIMMPLSTHVGAPQGTLLVTVYFGSVVCSIKGNGVIKSPMPPNHYYGVGPPRKAFPNQRHCHESPSLYLIMMSI